MPLYFERRPERLITEGGVRTDGRLPYEMRPIKMMVGVLERADGSAFIEWGGNRILAAVFGPREVHPKHMVLPDRALVRARYNMAPFSTPERRRPGPDRRSIELSKVIREALKPAIFVENYPGAVIDIFVEVLRSDAGTRVAGVNAASLALASAGIAMRGLVAACSIGRVGDFIVVDPNHDEDMWGDSDMPLAMMMESEEITLLQADGTLTGDQFREALDLGRKAIRFIYEVQKEALKRPYQMVERSVGRLV
ncbi:MAG: exosome complex exonuclease Rrp41 [Candidatus Korarchaeota archaeon NZ13-K]|nr:MAG: exosome complex exonuclease Rrp41 [Candidatus Korarchaeota archaeon NZ13-K]